MASKITPVVPEQVSDEAQEQTPASPAPHSLDEAKVAALVAEFASTPARATTLCKYLEEGGAPSDIASKYLLREQMGTTYARYFVGRVAEVLA